jgi:tetratricopeptide (TPR) repeat protein
MGATALSNNERQSPFLSVLYLQYLDQQDSTSYAAKVLQFYTPGTLERLAGHPDRDVRRAAVTALGLLGDYESNHTLGRAMLDDDRTVRMLAENAIRNIWNKAGGKTEQQHLGIVIRLNSAKNFTEAIRRASELLEKAPWFAEAWNQRAVAQFSLGKYAESIRDCHQALEINPYHFGAASSMGQAYLRLGNHVSALESFRRALRLNPSLEGVRVQVTRLSRMIEDK